MPAQPSGKRPPAKRVLGTRALTRLGRGGAAALLALAASAAVNYALARRAERRNPPQGRFVTVDGVRLHYVERGPAEHEGRPAIVLLHGVGAMIQEMTVSGIVDALAADHRIIVFDRPGFGYSERPRRRIWTPAAQAALLREALDRLGVARPVIVGHSWGTMVALEMALREPDRTAGLVLLCGYYFPTFRLDVPLLLWPAVPVVGDVLRYAISPWVGRLAQPLIYKTLFAPAPVPPSFASGFPSELALRPWQLRSAAAEVALLIPAASALAGRYRALRTPTAIVAAPGDRIVDFERHSARLYQALPRSTLRTLPRTGHMIHHSAPGQIAGVIHDTVRATGAGADGSGGPAGKEA
ncbi:MAG: alpha/beta fold hydrolase [Alphaproteobacteria bacterium]